MISSDNAVILLAAGNSTRMGAPKQLLDFRGKPLLRHALETALRSKCAGVVVVLGANAGAIRPSLAEAEHGGKWVEVAENPRWAEGMGTSIQAGLQAAERRGTTGIILALADQPLVTSAMLDRLVDAHADTGMPIVASQYAGTVGVPVFFSSEYFGQLLALAPDQGCKGVIVKSGDAALRIDCPEAAVDVDTPEDYKTALNG